MLFRGEIKSSVVLGWMFKLIFFFRFIGVFSNCIKNDVDE